MECDYFSLPFICGNFWYYMVYYLCLCAICARFGIQHECPRWHCRCFYLIFQSFVTYCDSEDDVSLTLKLMWEFYTMGTSVLMFLKQEAVIWYWYKMKLSDRDNIVFCGLCQWRIGYFYENILLYNHRHVWDIALKILKIAFFLWEVLHL